MGLWVGPLCSHSQIGNLMCRLSVSSLRGQAVARAGGVEGEDTEVQPTC